MDTRKAIVFGGKMVASGKFLRVPGFDAANTAVCKSDICAILSHGRDKAYFIGTWGGRKVLGRKCRGGVSVDFLDCLSEKLSLEWMPDGMIALHG